MFLTSLVSCIRFTFIKGNIPLNENKQHHVPVCLRMCNYPDNTFSSNEVSYG